MLQDLIFFPSCIYPWCGVRALEATHVRKGIIIVIATLEMTFIVEILLLVTKTSKLLFHVLGSIKYYQLKDLDGWMVALF